MKSWFSYFFVSFSCLLWSSILFLYLFSGSIEIDDFTSMVVEKLVKSGNDGRLLIIGDVRGCEKELQQLLINSNYDNDRDKIVFVGDMVGKGPPSQEVIQLAMDFNALCVRGNHEDILLSWYHSPEGSKTQLNPSYLKIAQQLTESQWNYLDSCPLYLQFDKLKQKIIVVHAGIDPSVSLDEQNLELVLNMRNHIAENNEFTKDYYQGKPWISTWNGPELIVFGHDAKRGIQVRLNEFNKPIAIGLDSGVVYGGKLSALAIPDMKILQVPALKMYKKP